MVNIITHGYSEQTAYSIQSGVKPWTTVDRVVTADGHTISLHEHDGDYSIRVDGAELMSTRQHASEEKLAVLACEHIASRPDARVLIGGLGFGFTLTATLGALHPRAAVVMAELLPAVVKWNRTMPTAAAAMADPRVAVVEEDVAATIRKSRGAFDSIILDVDNGPAALTAVSNDSLYSAAGLRRAYAALRPAGCLAVWSAAGNPAFASAMTRAGFALEVHHCRAHGNSGRRHTIFLGRAR